MSRTGKLLLAAVLFAAAGVLSELILGTGISDWFLGVAPGVIPFAILAAVLCVRPKLRMVITAILICAVWAGAFWVAVALDQRTPHANMFVAGFLGGLGVAVATGIGCRNLFRARPLLMLAAAGAVAAIPFQWPGFTEGDVGMAVAFAIWQGVVGTLLYKLSDR